MSKMSVSEEVKEYIISCLKDIENEFNVRVLYAVESGSRVWGFGNDDSDYDIRFIYLSDIQEYLKINTVRDVIDYNDLKYKHYEYDLDFSGWDIKKSLFQHYKSNPSLMEYLKSPIVYLGSDIMFNGLPDFDSIRLKHHYYSMTKGMWSKYVRGSNLQDVSSRLVKTFCYCIRQILTYTLLEYESPLLIPLNIFDLIKMVEDIILINNDLVNDWYSIINYYKGNCRGDVPYSSLINVSEWIERFLKEGVNIGGNVDVKDIDEYNRRFYNLLLIR